MVATINIKVEFNIRKDETNVAKHGVSLNLAREVNHYVKQIKTQTP